MRFATPFLLVLFACAHQPPAARSAEDSDAHAPDARVLSQNLTAGTFWVCGNAGIQELAAKVCTAGAKELRCGKVVGQGPTYSGETLPNSSRCCEYACPQGQ
jgi:hypothetical protein